ncbi:hypothetical protein VP01_2991g2 [Puccinia sorghi]|uniref:Uncharacterized protein n=1 Tax=Puccinia sorghi TaxID=27349 RepID=A0A0L6V0K5_9BASI|nr:hypothetical protein VP01_2991g2 [Puccinia sorghi]
MNLRLGMLVANVYSMLHLVFCNVLLEAISQDGWITNGAEAQLAYIRLMIACNKLERARNVGANTPMFWNQIDDNLQHRMCHASTYQFAFSKLILQKDKALWEGTQSYDVISIDAVSLPTETEIHNHHELTGSFGIQLF